MRLTPGRIRELVVALAVLCLVLLLAIGVAAWWVDYTGP
jgi:hypothetical protein